MLTCGFFHHPFGPSGTTVPEKTVVLEKNIVLRIMRPGRTAMRRTIENVLSLILFSGVKGVNIKEAQM